MILISPFSKFIDLDIVLYPTYLNSTVYEPGCIDKEYSPSKLVDAPMPVFKTTLAPIKGSLDEPSTITPEVTSVA